MPPKKYAIKGEPDFHLISDEKLNAFVDLTQQLIHAYNHYDRAKAEVLKTVWKDLSDERTSRLVQSAYAELDKQEKEGRDHTSPAPLLKKAPKMRKSPAKRNI